MEQHQLGHDDKRRRMLPDMQQQGNMVENMHPMPPADCDAPLGLKLKLTDPAETNCCDKAGKPAVSGETNQSSENSAERTRAAIFHGSLLRIGNWVYESRQEGGIKVKFFFLNQEIVWEFLDVEMKYKIKIPWSDIKGLTAHCPDNGHSFMLVVLGKPPLFYKAPILHPRMHTDWKPTSDFTFGEASVTRVHLLQCPQGTLRHPFTRLSQFNTRLNMVTLQPESVLGSPYFRNIPSSVLNESEQPAPVVSNPIIGAQPSSGSVIPYATLPVMPSAVQPSPYTYDGVPEMAVRPMEGQMNQMEEGNFKPAGLIPSVSSLGVTNYSGAPAVADPSPAGAAEHKDPHEDLTELLLKDVDIHSAPLTDQRSLMSSSDSFSNPFQNDPVDGSKDTMGNETTEGTNNDQWDIDDLLVDPTTNQRDGQSPLGMEEARDNPAMQMQPPGGAFW